MSVLFTKDQFRSVIQCICFGICASFVFSNDTRPEDADIRIVPGQSVFIVRMMEIIALVGDLCDIGEYQEAMGTALRYQQLFSVCVT